MPSLIHRLFTSDEVETRSETASLCVETAQTESAVGVIQAEELHSAAPTLVELFHEEAPAQEAETASTEHVDPNEDEPARDYDPVTGGSAAVAVASEAALTPNDDTTSDDEARVESAASAADGFHDEPHVAIPSPPSTAESHRAPYRDWAFDEKLASHREWVESHGLTGKRADLSGAELEAIDLISVNLRLADLHDANLQAPICCSRTCGTRAWCAPISRKRALWARIWKARTWRARHSKRPWGWCRGSCGSEPARRAPGAAADGVPGRGGNSSAQFAARVPTTSTA